MARYDELRDILGLDDEDEDEISDDSEKSEDDLWNKLDKPNFSDFD